MFEGKILGIYSAAKKGEAVQSYERVEVRQDGGIVGDRYDQDAGTLKGEIPRGLTFIEKEALDGVKRDYKMDITPEMTRRNILVEGVPLNHLVGRQFQVGDVVIEGVELAEPCGYLQKLNENDQLKKVLRHRGGLRARIVKGGTLEVGAIIHAAKG